MTHQRYKDLCFFLAQPALCAAGWGYRFAWRWLTRRCPPRLHVGCGRRYLPSFINVDINPFQKIDLWLDIRNRLPFPADALEGIYAQEMLEHFYPDELGRLLHEWHRVLKPGGFIRIEVPHLRHAAEAYLAGEFKAFPDWPRSYRSLGGRLSNYLLCDGQHRNVFDFSMWEELFRAAGFSNIQECQRGRSRWIESAVLSPIESEEYAFLRLYVEAQKP